MDKDSVGIQYIICECGDNFPNEKLLNVHLLNGHGDLETFQCESCPEIFTSENLFEQHRDEHKIQKLQKKLSKIPDLKTCTRRDHTSQGAVKQEHLEDFTSEEHENSSNEHTQKPRPKNKWPEPYVRNYSKKATLAAVKPVQVQKTPPVIKVNSLKRIDSISLIQSLKGYSGLVKVQRPLSPEKILPTVEPEPEPEPVVTESVMDELVIVKSEMEPEEDVNEEIYYQCDVCNTIFNTEADFDVHYQSTHAMKVEATPEEILEDHLVSDHIDNVDIKAEMETVETAYYFECEMDKLGTTDAKPEEEFSLLTDIRVGKEMLATEAIVDELDDLESQNAISELDILKENANGEMKSSNDHGAKLSDQGELLRIINVADETGFSTDVYVKNEMIDAPEAKAEKRNDHTVHIEEGNVLTDVKVQDTEENSLIIERNVKTCRKPGRPQKKRVGRPRKLDEHELATGIIKTQKERRKEQMKKAQERYRKKNPEKLREAARTYAKKHAEFRRRAVAKYTKAHPEVNRRASAKYAKAHPEVNRRASAKYAKAHPEVNRRSSARYAHKKKLEKMGNKVIINDIDETALKKEQIFHDFSYVDVLLHVKDEMTDATATNPEPDMLLTELNVKREILDPPEAAVEDLNDLTVHFEVADIQTDDKVKHADEQTLPIESNEKTGRKRGRPKKNRVHTVKPELDSKDEAESNEEREKAQKGRRKERLAVARKKHSQKGDSVRRHGKNYQEVNRRACIKKMKNKEMTDDIELNDDSNCTCHKIFASEEYFNKHYNKVHGGLLATLAADQDSEQVEQDQEELTEEKQTEETEEYEEFIETEECQEQPPQPKAPEQVIYFKCDLCKILYPSEQAYNRHFSKKHGGAVATRPAAGFRYIEQDLAAGYTPPPAQDDFCCEFCPKTFPMKRSLQVHRKRVHAERCAEPRAPPAGGKAPNRSKVCDICGRAYNSNAALRYHQRRHTGEKPYPCTMCPKRFTMPMFLQIHLRTHTGEKPYECPQCPKAFTNKAALIRHDRVHTGLKPYPCPECGKFFTQSNSMKLHVSTVHLKLPAPYKSKSRRSKSEARALQMALKCLPSDIVEEDVIDD